MPLRQIAVGLLLVAAAVRVAGVDVLPDPLGWLLVLGAAQRLGGDADTRGRVVAAAGVALLVSLPLVVPALARAVADADPSIAWVVSLPQVAFLLLLARHLTASAAATGAEDAAAWWRWVRTGAILMAVLPPLAFPTGSPAAIGGTLLVGLVVLVLTIVLLWAHGTRPWTVEQATGPTGPVISPADPDSPS